MSPSRASKLKLMYQNNTLASYDSCVNDDVEAIGSTGDNAVFAYIAGGFLDAATIRLNNYLIDGQYSLNQNDTYAMMELCSYEYATYGESCNSDWERLMGGQVQANSVGCSRRRNGRALSILSTWNM